MGKYSDYKAKNAKEHLMLNMALVQVKDIFAECDTIGYEEFIGKIENFKSIVMKEHSEACREAVESADAEEFFDGLRDILDGIINTEEGDDE